MSAPSVRGFQLDSSAIGNVSKSVNLYRGDVNLPLKLVSLEGPQGLNVLLTGYYGSNVGQQVTTWNREAPTGVLGLGWSMPFDCIAFAGGGTASWLEGSFTLNTGGNAHPLTLVSWSGAAGSANETLVFADPLNALWSFTFTPASETWTVVREDGLTLVFGDASSGRNTVQWGVRWGNWAGNSASSGNAPTRFGLVWNLSTMTNRWGNQVVYAYTEDTATVTTVDSKALTYTRASYLSQITDAYDRTVRFTYDDKDTLEYQAPNTVEGAAPSAAYQDRYETQYLAQIDICPPGSDGSVVYYSLIFGYEVKDLGPTASGATASSNQCKRYLTQVTQTREGVDVLPATIFAYNLEAGSTGAGRLTTVTYPSGGQVTWTYADIDLADPTQPQNVFNLTYEAERPSDSKYNGVYDDAYPKLWFGADFIIVGWYAQEAQALLLRVYSYGGRWSEPWETVIQGVNPATTASDPTPGDQLDAILLALGSDFFTLYFHNVAAQGTDSLYVFQKKDYQFGQWAAPAGAPYALTDIPASATLDETVLVAGRDMAAIHVSGTAYVFRLAYNRVSKTWSDDRFLSQDTNTTKAALAAQNNTLAVAFFGGDSVVNSEPYISYLDGAYAWQTSPPGTFQSLMSIPWNSVYAWDYWQMGQGFVAGTSLQSNSPTPLIHLIWWDRNFTGWREALPDVPGASAEIVSRVAGSVVSNAGNAWRFDGAEWQGAGTPLDWQPTTDSLAATVDTVVKASLSGGEYQSIEGNAFNAVSGRWEPFTLDQTPAASSQYPRGPAFAGDYLTIGNEVYARATDISAAWRAPVSSADNPLSTAAPSTIANLGPTFIAYQNYDNRNDSIYQDDFNSYVALLKNGDILTIPAAYQGQRLQAGDTAAVMCGATAFATYSALAPSFGEVGAFTLHRILNQAVTDQTDCVVSQLTISTGVQELVTTYDYAKAQAVFDPSGTVAQYPTATATRLSAADGTTQLGQTVYEYYNGLSGSGALASCYSLANGYMHTVTEYNAAGDVVAITNNGWAPVTYTTVSDGGFCPIDNVITLQSATVTHQQPGLPVMPLDGSSGNGKTATLGYTQSFAYDAKTAQPLSNSITQYNSHGIKDTRTVSYIYAWTEFPGMKSARQLTLAAQMTVSDSSGTVQSFAFVYDNAWGTAAPAAWDISTAYFWGGSGSTTFDFANPTQNPNWVLQYSYTGRNAKGLLTQGIDPFGVVSSVLYDKEGAWPVAQLVNATSAAFMGFQSYEDASDWTFTGTDAGIQAGDTHTGSRCAHVPAGGSLSNAALKADGGTYVFSCWVKGSTSAEWTITSGGGSASIAAPTGDSWQYVFKYVDTGTSAGSVTAKLSNSGSASVLVDDIRFTPLVSKFTANVYDEATRYEVAQIGRNGETLRTFYDNRLRTVGKTTPDGDVSTIYSRYYTDAGLEMFDASDPNPNSKLIIRAREGGPWDDFRDGAGWQSRWSGSASAWQVVDQALAHQGTSEDAVTLNGSEDYASYGVKVTVAQQDGKAIAGAFGIKIGSELSVRWNPSATRWELAVSGTVEDTFSGTATGTMELLLIAGAHGVVVFLNDRQILSYAGASATAIQGQLGLFASDDGLGFAQVLVFKQPVLQLSYLDGTKRWVQKQKLADNQIVARHSVFDELGRANIRTKPILYDQAVLGYQAGLVTSFDDSTGVMAGDVADYYAGQDGRSDDGGYPYIRKQVEDTSLQRLQAFGQPGADFAIGASAARPTTYAYGVNGPSALFDGNAATQEQYNVVLRTDPEGLNGARVADQMMDVVGQVMGGSGLPKGSHTAAFLYDGKGNLETTDTPNEFDPPSQADASAPASTQPESTEPAPWTANSSFNYRNDRMTLASRDTGTRQVMRDQAGRLRFDLMANGAATSSASPCASNADTPITVIYRLYDNLQRVIEIGTTCVAAWDDLTQHVNDRTWPANVATWRQRFSYDGDGSAPNAIGRLTSQQTNNAGTVATGSFAYDSQGNTTSYTVDDGVNAAATTTYGFDKLGRITSVTYPAIEGMDSLTVVYGYDARDLLATIGTAAQPDCYARYSYNALERLETATIGNATGSPITRSYTYNAPGWLKSISDELSSETLYYQDSTPEKSNTPRYNGQASAITYTRSSDKTDFTWLYGYDAFGRIEQVKMGASVDRTYAYDNNGNLTSISNANQKTSFTYAGTNFLQSTSLSSDAAPVSSGGASNGVTFTPMPSGEVQSAGDLSFTYDFPSQLTEQVRRASTNETLTMTYGGGLQRLSKTLTDSGGTKTSSRRYIPGVRRGQRRALVEQAWSKASGTTRNYRYIYGRRGILAVEIDGTPYFVLQDHQQSSRIMVADAKSAPIATFDYLPFGAPYGTAGGSNPDDLVYRFTGQEWDAETGLYNYRQRLYDPSVERFYSPDPMRQYASPYIYVGNAPILHTDPTGDKSFFTDAWHSIEGSRTFGYVFSAVEIVAGIISAPVTLGAGITITVAGIYGIGYTASAKNFNASQYFQVNAAALISSGEVGAGIALDVVTDGGSGPISSMLIGAGLGGLVDTGYQEYQMSRDPNATFDWEEFGIAQGIGAASGLLMYYGGSAIGYCCSDSSAIAAPDVAADGPYYADDDDDAIDDEEYNPNAKQDYVNRVMEQRHVDMFEGRNAAPDYEQEVMEQAGDQAGQNYDQGVGRAGVIRQMGIIEDALAAGGLIGGDVDP